MPAPSSEAWPVERLQGATTIAADRDSVTWEWTPERALHEAIINHPLAGTPPETRPTIFVVTGGIGSGNQL